MKKRRRVPIRKLAHRVRAKADWRTAMCIDRLLEQVNDAYPNRSKGVDGTKGDDAHAARESDHNPDDNGVVHAVDITHDPRHGFDSYLFADMMRQKHDHRLHMIISNRRVSGDQAFCDNNPHYHAKLWEWAYYDGASAHDKHCHFSIVRDPVLADDKSDWDIGETILPDPNHPPVPEETVLFLHSSGGLVKELQHLLGIEEDGDFGKQTQAAVKRFQLAHGMTVDGIVGAYTWHALRAAPPPVVDPATPPAPAPTPTTNVYDAIAALAEKHSIMRYSWPGRGQAPAGYIKGMACSFASALARLNLGDTAVKEMAKANTGASNKDALAWYNARFENLGMLNNKDGPDTLRHLFVLMLGLGMRETSGQYCDGRDYAANNVRANSAEAGLFQMSWDAADAHPEIRKLLARYTGDGFLDVYSEDVHCTPKQLRNFGSGDGLQYQKMAKSKPDFAVLCAGVGLRNIRQHWGPINRREVTLNPQADAMFRQVQQLMAMQGGLIA